eukprot:4061749-Prymnesium_polylepis.2
MSDVHRAARAGSARATPSPPRCAPGSLGSAGAAPRASAHTTRVPHALTRGRGMGPAGRIRLRDTRLKSGPVNRTAPRHRWPARATDYTTETLLLWVRSPRRAETGPQHEAARHPGQRGRLAEGRAECSPHIETYRGARLFAVAPAALTSAALQLPHGRRRRLVAILSAWANSSLHTWEG